MHVQVHIDAEQAKVAFVDWREALEYLGIDGMDIMSDGSLQIIIAYRGGYHFRAAELAGQDKQAVMEWARNIKRDIIKGITDVLCQQDLAAVQMVVKGYQEKAQVTIATPVLTISKEKMQEIMDIARSPYQVKKEPK